MWKWVRAQWSAWRRWHYADRLGWATWGGLWRMREDEANSFEAHWRVRSANRLYRLTRGHGNPWKPYKGY